MARLISPLILSITLAALARYAAADTTVTHPYEGITLITRTETTPRPLTMHIALIDLRAPGISFAVTPHTGTRETTRRTTADFVRQQNAQLGINVAFFDPVALPASADPEVFLAGLHVSEGHVVSDFDPQPAPGFRPDQSYAIVPFAPALNIDAHNHAMMVHRDPSAADNHHVLEHISLWNAISGSAQIITDGRITVPEYKDFTHPSGLLTPGGPPGNNGYNNDNSWYNLRNARTATGITRDAHTLVLFTVDRDTANPGMTVGDVAQLLLDDYHCYNALNLDGGGSTSMALRDPATGRVHAINHSADTNYPEGRPAGANLAVFAQRPSAPTAALAIASAAALLVALAVGAARGEE